MYLPCPMDPQTAVELERGADPGASSDAWEGVRGPRIIFDRGIPYVETVPWEGLVRHAEAFFPGLASCIRKKVDRELFGSAKPGFGVNEMAHLETVVFHVLPRFVRLPRWVKSAENKPMALALWLSKKTGVPERFFRWAEDMQREEGGGDRRNEPVGFPCRVFDDVAGRVLGARAVRQELEAALEKTRREALEQQQEALRTGIHPYRNWPSAALGFLLWVLSRGSLEVEGFGFLRRASDGAVVIYKRTGRYALRDYYNRLYLFSDCRVAVTSQDLWPVVMECYKHPLLPRHQPWQRICLGRSPAGRAFTAPHIIQSLEDGLNALYYGYDARKRNGYHSLDHFPGFQRDIHFDDLRIPSDDPRCLSGEIPITNAFS